MSLSAAWSVGTADAPDERADVLSLRGVHAVAVGSGHDDGRLAVEAVLQCVRMAAPALRKLAEHADHEAENRLAVLSRLERLFDTATGVLHRDNLGIAAATVAVESGGRLFVGHVGNTRLDLMRKGRWTRVTLDHSVAAERVRLGEMTEQEAADSSERHVLYQALGRIPAVRPDLLELHLAPLDRLALSTPDLLTNAAKARVGAADELQPAADAMVQGAGSASAALVLVQELAEAAPADLPGNAWLLDAIPLFEGFDGDARRRLAPYLREVQLPAGRILFREGDDADELFAVVEGGLAVSSEAVQLTTLGPGDHFGEVGLTLGGRRTATVKATSSTRLVGLDRDRLNELLRARPELAALFMQGLVESLAERVHDLTGRLVEKTWSG